MRPGRFSLPQIPALLLALIIQAPSTTAAEPEYIWNEPGWGKPLAELPAHVPSQAGRLTLFADFDNPHEEHVRVYLINRTTEPVSMKLQGSNPFLKLEYEPLPGVWVRAQPHYFSSCGTIYDFKSLPPDRFKVFYGKRFNQGLWGTVRYRIYNQEFAAVSNAEKGLVDLQETGIAATDQMALRAAFQGRDFSFIRKVALGEIGISASNRLKALRCLVRSDFDSLAMNEVLEITATDADEHVSGYSRRLLNNRKKRAESGE